MPKSVSANYTTEKNSEVCTPIWLYRVQTTDDTANDLFFAEYHEVVPYYKDAGTPQDYTPFPITHGGIQEMQDGSIHTIDVSVSNVDLEKAGNLQSYLELNDALRGRKVTIRQVFYENLRGQPNDDSLAYIEFIMYVDSATATDDMITLTLSRETDVLSVELPRRKYTRGFCQFRYKGLGCWEEDSNGDPSMPAGFITSDSNISDSCNKTAEQCALHNNSIRFGGYPGVPYKRVTRL